MWVFTKTGFYSIVLEKDAKKPNIIIRARCKQHLEQLKATHPKLGLGKIIHTPNGDYHWRCKATKAMVANILADATLDIDYDNFKKACRNKMTTAVDVRWQDAMYDVWASTELFQSRVELGQQIPK